MGDLRASLYESHQHFKKNESVKELKGRINDLNLQIHSSKEKIQTFFNPKASIDHLKSPKLQTPVLTSPSTDYNLLNDEYSRPIYETSMLYINQKEKELREAQEIIENATRDVDRIKREENTELERVIDYEIAESEKRKNRLREEFENRLKAIEIELKETIVQKKLESEKRVQRRMQSYHGEIAKQTRASQKSGVYGIERAVSPLSRLESRKQSPTRHLSPPRNAAVYSDDHYPTQQKSHYERGYISPKKRDLQQVSLTIESRLDNLKHTLDQIRGQSSARTERY